MVNSNVSLLFILFLLSTCSYGQSTSDSIAFDFWVGTWNASWKNPDGTTGKGINRITKILDGKVIQGNFEDLTPGGLRGTSITVYHTATNTWRQAWADNQGSYFDLEGKIENGKRYFRTKLREKDGKRIFQRIVFHAIKPDSFTWDWESTTDGGETWKLQWQIDYTRASK